MCRHKANTANTARQWAAHAYQLLRMEDYLLSASHIYKRSITAEAQAQLLPSCGALYGNGRWPHCLTCSYDSSIGQGRA